MKELLKYLHNKTILYVEDDIQTKNEIIDTLSFFSNSVLSANNGKEALDIFYKENIDLIITDIEMPHINGIELIKKIREENFLIPIIILTAYTSNDYLFESINLNIQSYIVKPITLDKLKDSLTKVIHYFDLKQATDLLNINETVHYDPKNNILVFKEGQTVVLNKKEKQLLELLLNNRNQFVSYETIEYEIWTKHDNIMTQSALRTLVKTLRKKLNNYESIQNISGLGYKISSSS